MLKYIQMCLKVKQKISYNIKIPKWSCGDDTDDVESYTVEQLLLMVAYLPLIEKERVYLSLSDTHPIGLDNNLDFVSYPLLLSRRYTKNNGH